MTGVIFLTAFTAVQAQKARLSLPIPAFRVGDNVEIKYELYKDNTTDWESKVGEGSIKLEKTFLTPGKYPVGPLFLQINGVKYASDTIAVQVDDALPEEKNGIWIRQVQFNGKEYILVEQRIGGDWETVSTGTNSTNTSFKAKSDEFAEIDPGQLDNAPVNLQFNYSYSTTQNMTEGSSANYKISVYVLAKQANFSGSFTLTRKHFKDLDAKTPFTSFIIH